jgi:hypothetical protein
MIAAEKILRRMRRSLAGWNPEDFATLYNGYGFEAREGRGHTIYVHMTYRHLRATVARHGPLAKGYAEHAIGLIDQLAALEAQAAEAAAKEEAPDDEQS